MKIEHRIRGVLGKQGQHLFAIEYLTVWDGFKPYKNANGEMICYDDYEKAEAAIKHMQLDKRFMV